MKNSTKFIATALIAPAAIWYIHALITPPPAGQNIRNATRKLEQQIEANKRAKELTNLVIEDIKSSADTKMYKYCLEWKTSNEKVEPEMHEARVKHCKEVGINIQ